MNLEQLKNENPELYKAIFNAGTIAERQRVESWMEYAETNLDEVKKGITSGNDLNHDVDNFYAEIDFKIKSNRNRN